MTFSIYLFYWFCFLMLIPLERSYVVLDVNLTLDDMHPSLREAYKPHLERNPNDQRLIGEMMAQTISKLPRELFWPRTLRTDENIKSQCDKFRRKALSDTDIKYREIVGKIIDEHEEKNKNVYEVLARIVRIRICEEEILLFIYTWESKSRIDKLPRDKNTKVFSLGHIHYELFRAKDGSFVGRQICG